jgi:hypothetical protein
MAAEAGSAAEDLAGTARSRREQHNAAERALVAAAREAMEAAPQG